MKIRENRTKSENKSGIDKKKSTTPTPQHKKLYAKRISSAADLKKLASKLMAQLQKGAIDESKAKSIGYLIQQWLAIDKHLKLEEDISEQLNYLYRFMQSLYRTYEAYVNDAVIPLLKDKNALEEFDRILSQNANKFNKIFEKKFNEVSENIKQVTEFKDATLKTTDNKLIVKLMKDVIAGLSNDLKLEVFHFVREDMERKNKNRWAE